MSTLTGKERPILFSGPMVRALLEGRKTMTRRVVKPPPVWLESGESCRRLKPGTFFYCPDLMPTSNERNLVFGIQESVGARRFLGMRDYVENFSPYGMPGDRLWVRETHWRFGKWVRAGLTKTGKQKWRFRVLPAHAHVVCFEPPQVKPRRVTQGWHKRPSIFMPRWASRITLEIVSVRVERVQEITRESAIAEGVDWKTCPTFQTEAQIFAMIEGRGCSGTIDYVKGFQKLWDSLNAKRGLGWDVNPWVWVIEFKRMEGTS